MKKEKVSIDRFLMQVNIIFFYSIEILSFKPAQLERANTFPSLKQIEVIYVKYSA